MPSASLFSVGSVPSVVLSACPESRSVATLRSVSRSWHQGVRRALRVSEVRRQLGCHLWDGTLACRAFRLDYSVPGSDSLYLAHAIWSPSGDRLWCLFAVQPSSKQPHHLVAFNAAAEMQIEWEIPPRTCLSAVLHFTSDTELLCLMMDDHELHMMQYETCGRLRSSRMVDLRSSILGGNAEVDRPVISTDGQRAALSVSFVEVDDEDSPVAESSCCLIMIDIPGASVEWTKVFGYCSVLVVGFTSVGIVVSGDTFVGMLDEVTRRIVPLLPHSGPPANEWACLSPDRLQLVDGHSIYRFAERCAEGRPPALQKHCDLEIRAARGTHGACAWSPDGARIACVRGRWNGPPFLDVFHSETGALLWRRSLGQGSHSLLMFSPDGFSIFVTRSTLGGKDVATILVPAL